MTKDGADQSFWDAPRALFLQGIVEAIITKFAFGLYLSVLYLFQRSLAPIYRHSSADIGGIFAP